MAHRADSLRKSPLLGPALVVLALLEAAWLVWFLAEPLPNAANVGGQVRRWLLLARALPQVVPGVTFRQSYLGLTIHELEHVENLPQRLPIVLAAALIGGAAVGLGDLIFRGLRLHRLLGTMERIALAYGVGTSALGVAILIAGRLGGLSPWAFRIGTGLLIAAATALLLRDRFGSRGRNSPNRDFDDRVPVSKASPPALLSRLTLGLIVAPFLFLMILGAMLPTIDFDAIEYHLQGPKEYYQAGRIAFLPHNVYTSMPFGVEMLHLAGMEVLDDWWWGALAGQLLIATYAPAAAVLIAATARRLASARAAWVAAVVYLTTPWIYRLGVLPYVEGPLCFYHAALIWVVARVWNEADSALRTRLWALAGLLAGGAMACKYPALVSAVVPFGVVALITSLRTRTWRCLATFALGWAVIIGPWLGKNLIDTGNPVYPLAYQVFGGRFWDRELDLKWSNVHGPKPVSIQALRESFADVVGRSDWQSPLYSALALLAFFRPGSARRADVLWGYVAYLFSTWWLLTHRLDRFWLPLLPPLAILAGLGADWVRNRAWSVLLGMILAVSIATNLAYVSTALAGFNEWTGDLEEMRTRVPKMLNAPLARLDAELPSESRVLVVGQAAVFHFRHSIVYNTVFNRDTFETLTRGRTPEEVRQALRRLGVTHVYVDWLEIDRYRSPGNYGFTTYVIPQRFADLVTAGVLAPARSMGPRQELYDVRLR